ncbi:thioredoxin domain-containing protein [Pelagicoccus sp. SDUM812003]|uniref:thioredoxin domain-containing protein n=1 Tax=Pelagicoccus sp. SDUM812003 TaxID=3041267 RepID=UPI002810629B|nr:thioredoxin domain-containing protein [Pelagicoccus sp. SDUM812003]MDQ8203906.1 thioredoxin domain-containing protein [Pelagicoccus sp. SDUM812003]
MPRIVLQILSLSALLPFGLQAANHLADSQSPYLLQHADNPVDWYPWGDEAIEKAQRENKLVFISIGYSTCHWCHVMNRESFSNEEIAAYLNEHYVCIKIDREERPDLDSVYMNFVFNLRGSAGWPLNVWLTPDLKPFFGGTYFPPYPDPDRGPGFLDLSREIQESWAANPQEITQRSESFVASINQTTQERAASSGQIDAELVSTAITSYLFQYDDSNGGFGKGEKFPTPSSLSFLLRAANNSDLHPEDRELAQRMATETLDAMLRGGIRDHIGGGFHRYTVDPEWKLPHFEKMLYDQALVSNALIDAWQLTGEERYRAAATETLSYLLREMRHPSGAFYSAEDAESLDPDNPDTKREGAFYLWSIADIEAVFPDEQTRNLARAAFALRPAGNAPFGDFPTEIFQGYNCLRRARSLDSLAQEFALSVEEVEEQIDVIKDSLFELRSQRQRPHLDDKLICSWNGLAISAFARAALAFQRPDFADAASEAATFIQKQLYRPETGELIRLYREDASEVKGFSEDYAFLIEGLLDLYEATANHKWLVWARELQEAQNKRFLDTDHGGFYLFEATDKIVFDPSKRQSDGALPSPNSISVANLARLSQIFDDATYQKEAKRAAAALLPELEQTPTALPALLSASAYVTKKPLQIVIAGDPNADDVQSLRAIANRRLLPNRLLLHADGAKGQAFLGERLEFIESVRAIGGKATAYVCENFVCQLPTSDPEAFAAQLDEKIRLVPQE